MIIILGLVSALMPGQRAAAEQALSIPIIIIVLVSAVMLIGILGFGLLLSILILYALFTDVLNAILELCVGRIADAAIEEAMLNFGKNRTGRIRRIKWKKPY
jgi:hypothetical protein